MDSVVENYGNGLRRLCLNSPEEDERLLQGDIAYIGAHCSLLEDLALTLWRSKGDATEVAIYRALGSLPKLQYLSFALDT
jgi:hypothetical protein